MVEKPKAAEARPIFHYALYSAAEIFGILEKQATGPAAEIQLTDAMVALARQQPFYGLKIRRPQPSIAVQKSDFLPPISLMDWKRPISRRNCAPNCGGC